MFFLFFTLAGTGFFSFSGQFFLPFQIFFLFLAHSLPAPFADTKVKIFYLKVSTSLFAFFTLFSFPMIYLIERGNIIVLVLPLLLYFVNEYDSDVKYKRHLAYICLAISVAIKIYPVFFGLLLLKKKKNFKNILLCIFYGAVFFFVPFIFVGGFSQLGVLIHNILYTSSMFGSKGFGFKVSISNTFSLFGHVFNHVRLFETAGTMFLIITVLAGLFLILFNKWNEDWKRCDRNNG